MKIYKRDDFIKSVPEGSLYSKGTYEDLPNTGVGWGFSGFYIKGQNLCNDFLYIDLLLIDYEDSRELFNKAEKMYRDNASYPINESDCRDGCFDDTDIFLVYEKGDLEFLYNHISKLIGK